MPAYRSIDTAKVLWQLYIGISIVEILTLLVAGSPFFESLLTTFGTMPTGGFHPRTLSIGAYDNVYVEVIVLMFMIMAETNFQSYYFTLWKREARRVLKSPEFQAYIGIFVAATPLIALDLIMNGGYVSGTAFRYAV